MSSATVTHGYDVSSFFCNYYCSKWYQKHWICNWLVKENNFGRATFWVRYLFPSLSFLRYFLQRLTGKNWFASFITTTFLNFRELRRSLPCSRISSQLLSTFRYYVCAIHHRNKQQDCWNCSHRVLLNYKLF